MIFNVLSEQHGGLLETLYYFVIKITKTVTARRVTCTHTVTDNIRIHNKSTQNNSSRTWRWYERNPKHGYNTFSFVYLCN